MTTASKKSVNTTCRILINKTTIYTSSQMCTKMMDAEMLVRLNQNKFAPYRGTSPKVWSYLQKLAREFPEHFMAGSRRILTL